MRYEVIVKGLEKFRSVFKLASSTNKQMQELNNNFIASSQQMKEMITSAKGNDIGNNFKEQAKAVDEFNKKIANSKESLMDAFGMGNFKNYSDNLTSFFSLGKKGFGSLTKSIGVAIKSLGPITLALGAIALVMKVIKQAFKWNIGGITAKWMKGVGEFRMALGKLKLATYGLFKAMAPVFRAIGNVLMFVLKIVTALINAITSLVTLVAGNKNTLSTFGGYGGGSSNTTNNNVTVITNKPIDSSGAKGFQESLNNSMWR